VKDTIEALMTLQDRDRKMLKYMREARDIPERKNLIEGQLAESQEALTSAEEKQKENTAAQKTLEVEIDSVKGKIAKYKTQQLNVKNNDEYRALENQIVMCRKEIEKLENREIDLMEAAETIKADLEACQQKLTDAQGRVDAEKDALDRRLANTTEDIKRMQEKRAKMIEELEELKKDFQACGMKDLPVHFMGFLPQIRDEEDMKKLVPVGTKTTHRAKDAA